MKVAATLALIAAAVVYVVASLIRSNGGGWLGFIRSGSEAAMVGGLADWFAVTALFRRPLGLPFPHTALVPRKKDDLATKLGEFVTGHFITPEALQRQVKESGVVARVGEWLADDGHADALARDLAVAGERALVAVEPDDVVAYLVHLAKSGQARGGYAPMLGALLSSAVDGGVQTPLVSVLALRGSDYLRTQAWRLHPMVKRFIEQRNWVASIMTTDRFVERLLRDAAAELDGIARRTNHPLRIALEDLLRGLSTDLQESEEMGVRVNELAERLLADERVRAVGADLVDNVIKAVRASMGGDGELTSRLARLISRIGIRLASDPALHAQAEGWLTDVIGHAVGRYGAELTHLIQRQVGDWPAAAASRRIELAVGRDLQYIRINGTVVGAIAGVAIHGVTLLLP